MRQGLPGCRTGGTLQVPGPAGHSSSALRASPVFLIFSGHAGSRGGGKLQKKKQKKTQPSKPACFCHCSTGMSSRAVKKCGKIDALPPGDRSQGWVCPKGVQGHLCKNTEGQKLSLVTPGDVARRDPSPSVCPEWVQSKHLD